MGTASPGAERVLSDVQRAATWRLLAQLYRREIDADLARRMEKAGLPEVMASVAGGVLPVRLDDETSIPRLRREYTRIFLGPGAHVAPYGSVHHPGDLRKGQLWGTTTQWFRRFATAHGVKFDGRAYQGIPDHIGHELEFYASLLVARSQARRAGDRPRQARLDHSISLLYHRQLIRWVPRFLDRVLAIAEPRSFYWQLVTLSRVLLEAEGTQVAPPGVEVTP